ncbi:MAG: DNA-binding response regulator, partial [Acidimicrobiia bacterium]|nr:DNA-binding response regulator [Acidimicrobiia bacterium]
MTSITVRCERADRIKTKVNCICSMKRIALSGTANVGNVHHTRGGSTAMKSESSTRELETSKVRVLVCDDHSIVREALTTVLNASSSFEVTAQTEGFDDTIELLTDTDVDAVVLDIRLKGTSGLELARCLRQDAPSVRILLLTGFLNDEILLEAEAIGVDGIMDK